MSPDPTLANAAAAAAHKAAKAVEEAVRLVRYSERMQVALDFATPPDWGSALREIDERCGTREQATREAFMLGLGCAKPGCASDRCGAKYTLSAGDNAELQDAVCELLAGHAGSHTSRTMGWSWVTDSHRAKLAEDLLAETRNQLDEARRLLTCEGNAFDAFRHGLTDMLSDARALKPETLVGCYRDAHRATPADMSYGVAHETALVAVAEMARQEYERRLRRRVDAAGARRERQRAKSDTSQSPAWWLRRL